MSVVFSGNYSDRFISNGTPQLINLPAGVDWMFVRNETVLYAAGAGTGAEFFWQKGMTQGQGVIYTKTAVTNALAPSQIAAGAGFTLVNTSFNSPGPSVALTGITNGNPPVVNTGSTSGLINGSIVRIYNTVGAQQLGGIEFTVGAVTTNTSFTLAYMAQIANANPGAGTYRIIPYDPIFYPTIRTISKISQATQAIVTLTVTHGYTVGQRVRFVIPTVTATAFGMTQLNGVEATIVAVGQADGDGVTNTITISVDTTGFTAFAFPLTANGAFTPAQVIPVGENTAEALSLNTNILGDSTINTAQMGMLLAAGTNSPAGVNTNVIYWIAGKSFNQ